MTLYERFWRERRIGGVYAAEWLSSGLRPPLFDVERREALQREAMREELKATFGDTWRPTPP